MFSRELMLCIHAIHAFCTCIFPIDLELLSVAMAILSLYDVMFKSLSDRFAIDLRSLCKSPGDVFCYHFAIDLPPLCLSSAIICKGFTIALQSICPTL
jgi:hypothetical protein